MDFDEALRWLLGLTDYEQRPAVAFAPERFDLRRVEAMLETVGGPHRGPVTVHIAGTKGKGSTAAMTASVLDAAGYRTGLYTSPHLFSVLERIRCGERLIALEVFAALTARLKPVAEQVSRSAGYGQLTTFEVLTALAFLFFREENVEVQVLETGMGGRLDATNVSSPTVCVVTAISLDHTEVLGPTLAQIAKEKAGIIKPGVPVVSAPQPPEALAVLQQVCQAQGCQLLRVGKDALVSPGPFDLDGQSFTVTTAAASYHLWTPLLGAHQRENAACAVLALGQIAPSLPRGLPTQAFRDGFRKVSWQGRVQVLRRKPLLVADGAHNVASIQRLKETLRDCFAFRRLVLILGLSADKDVDGIVRELAQVSNEVVVARSIHPRALEPQVLVDTFRRYGITPRKAASAAEALSIAAGLAKEEDLVLATGSLFLVADVLAAQRTVWPEATAVEERLV